RLHRARTRLRRVLERPSLVRGFPPHHAEGAARRKGEPLGSPQSPSPGRGWAGPAANQRPVLYSGGLEGVRAARLLHPLDEVGPRALVPDRLAVPLEGEDVGRDAVEEPAVVRDHDGAAGELEQRLLERAQRVDVEVVRRLVEEQDVPARAQELRQVDAVPLAAREVADALLLVAALEVEPGDVLARVHLALAELDRVLVAADLLPDG